MYHHEYSVVDLDNLFPILNDAYTTEIHILNEKLECKVSFILN